PHLVYVSASGLGRTGPEARAVAYGTLLQCYAGFAGLNRHPEIAPRVGLAWLDPMCGLMLAFVSAAALWHRQRTGRVAPRRTARRSAQWAAAAGRQPLYPIRAARRLPLCWQR